MHCEYRIDWLRLNVHAFRRYKVFKGTLYAAVAGSEFPRLRGATPEVGAPTCYLAKFLTKTALKMKEIGPKGASIPSWICQCMCVLADDLLRPLPPPPVQMFSFSRNFGKKIHQIIDYCTPFLEMLEPPRFYVRNYLLCHVQCIHFFLVLICCTNMLHRCSLLFL